MSVGVAADGASAPPRARGGTRAIRPYAPGARPRHAYAEAGFGRMPVRVPDAARRIRFGDHGTSGAVLCNAAGSAVAAGCARQAARLPRSGARRRRGVAPRATVLGCVVAPRNEPWRNNGAHTHGPAARAFRHARHCAASQKRAPGGAPTRLPPAGRPRARRRQKTLPPHIRLRRP